MVHNNLVIKCHISSVVIYVKKESHLVKNMFYTVSISFSVSYFEGVICVRNALWEAGAAVSWEKALYRKPAYLCLNFISCGLNLYIHHRKQWL